MMRRRGRGVPEINLTPLLDVLFSILFIVMMTGMQNEKGMKEDYDRQTSRLEQEISELNDRLEKSKDQISSYEMYQTEAMIITVSNISKDGNHYLVIRQGLEEKEIDRILLGNDKAENVRTRIRGLIENFVDVTDNQPVYIVFHCDKKNIYTIEYRIVEEEFNKLQQTHKEVFFKVTEG